MRQAGKILAILAVIAYPLLIHASIRDNEVAGLRLLFVVLPPALALLWFAWRAVGGVWKLVVVGAFLAMLYFVLNGQHERIGLIAVDGISHATFNLFMLWFFGRTLAKGNEPLITQISRRINGELEPDIVIYTRHVTQAWCIYFAGQVTVSLLLYLFAPLSVWSLFVNVLEFPLLVLMFAGELVWRAVRYPHHSRNTILKAIEVYAKDFAGQGLRRPEKTD
jgi:uncharacterized membrane protein